MITLSLTTMPACKATLDAAKGIPYSTIVTTPSKEWNRIRN